MTNQIHRGLHKYQIPCILAVKDLSSSQANCRILSRNAQCFSSVNIPFQKLHPLQLSAFCDDQDT